MSTPAAHAESWTTRRLLNWMTEAFTKKGLDSPRLSAELLLTHVLGCDRLRLYMDADRPAAPLERDTLRDLVGRALKHEPIDYLVGEKWFFGMPFHVSPAVLVPRPSTETIVENVLLHARAEPGFGGKTGEGVRLADVCTGSGCIAVALLKHLSAANAVATDISADALAIAQRNADRHGVRGRIEFLQGDLLAPLNDAAGVSTATTTDLHYLLANPPYIPDHEWDAVPPNVKDHEPHSALRGGSDGMMFVRPLIEGAAGFLRPGGVLMVEVAACTAEQAAALASAQPDLERVRVLNDLDGLPRVVVANRRKQAA
ncbi:MAG: peptide chain release factor N(5)-glutamine methyltransferase [Phycisphaeraceae bacterium]|nr:peptide chain release factor N(5)-glutamine methyltransferase [Phycisphaeraceae bacterium]MBX3407190.1 peptide chain release factor N(5)-glutamine methyltransferase [Phycisphaeraceae bacterium]